MTHSDEFTEHILDLLHSVGTIQTRRMFGGTLLSIDNKQLGIVLKGTLYFKVKEPELQDKYELMDSEQFKYTRKDRQGPVIINNWWSIPDEVLENQKKLVALAHEVVLQGT